MINHLTYKPATIDLLVRAVCESKGRNFDTCPENLLVLFSGQKVI